MWLAMNILSVLLERAAEVSLKHSWDPQMDEYCIFRYSARLSTFANSLMSCCVTCEAQVRVCAYFYKYFATPA